MPMRLCSFSSLSLVLLLVPSNHAAHATPTGAPASTQLQEMQQVETNWDVAVNKRDQYGLENVLSPDLIDIAATGDVTTRNQDIAKLFSKDALPLSMTQKVLTVRTLSEGLVLVSGTYTLRWPEPNVSAASGTIDEKGIFTHVFQNVNGHWMCMDSQRTVVAEQMPQVKAKTTSPRAKSNAAEPFHVPLIYKGAQSTQSRPAAPPN